MVLCDPVLHICHLHLIHPNLEKHKCYSFKPNYNFIFEDFFKILYIPLYTWPNGTDTIYVYLYSKVQVSSMYTWTVQYSTGTIDVYLNSSVQLPLMYSIDVYLNSTGKVPLMYSIDAYLNSKVQVPLMYN